MKTQIIGMGEVGSALEKVLSPYYPISPSQPEILHICFPYSDDFISEVKRYQVGYQHPRITVIHSTVPVGTSRKLKACHSPIIGIHPYLEKSIKTFTKFVSGEGADEVADYFRRVGLKVQICRESETTELAKLTSTLYYGLCIEYAKEVEKLCESHKVPFSEVYTLWNKTYNEGYKKLGYEEVIRPVLQPIQRRIGGHCVIPNLDLLKSKFVDFLKSLNS